MKKIVSSIAIALAMTVACNTRMRADAYESATNNTYSVGDVDLNGMVDASDASLILSDYANVSVGGVSALRKELADVNRDGMIDASDASDVLAVYAELSTGEPVQLETVIVNDLRENDIIEYKVNFTYVFTKPEDNDQNLYWERLVLMYGERFVIIRCLPDDWYEISLESTDQSLYIRITEDQSTYFEKVGVATNTEPVGNVTTTTAEVTTTTQTETEVVTTTETEATTTASEVETTTTTATEVSTTMLESETTTDTSSVTETTETTTTVSETENTTTTGEVTTIVATTMPSEISNDIGIGSVVEFTETAWYIHDKITDSTDGDLYDKKNYLENGDRFIILDVQYGYWYVAYLTESPEDTIYLCILNDDMERYFNKVGEVQVEEVTSTTTVQVTTVPETTTTTETTTTAETTTEDSAVFTDWSYIRYISEESLDIHSSAEIAKNIVGTLKWGELFFIKSYEGNGWYRIAMDNVEENYYIFIDPQYTDAFMDTNYEVFEFTGLYWNIRSEKSKEDDTNIVGRVNSGELIAVAGEYNDGWAFIRTNTYRGFIYMDPLFVKM